MNEKNELRFITIFTAVFLTIFAISAVLMQNYGFLYYTIIASFFIAIMVFHYKKFYLTTPILFGLIILGFLHIMGLYINIAGVRLYDLYLIKNIFRYDNLVHSFGIFVATFVSYNILKPHLNVRIKNNVFLLSLILILMTLGIGVFNEIIELIAVVFLGAAERVGGYFNNALDLVFNLIGTIIASIVIIYYHKKGIKK